MARGLVAGAALTVLAGCLASETCSGWGADVRLPARQDFNRPREIQIVPPVTAQKSISVVSWNIARGGHLEEIAAEFEREPAELILLQEVDWNTARAGQLDEATELGRKLHLNVCYGIEFEELGQEREGQAFIGQATLTRLPIVKSRVLRFRRQSGFWKPHAWIPSSVPLMQRRLGSRIALVTELEFAGRKLVVYNAHLESRSYGRVQNEQIDEILDDLKQYPPGTAVLLGGDLNTKYFPSIFLRKLERAGFASSTGERIERTHTIAMALDWVFAEGDVRIGNGRVRRDWKGSDHYPVWSLLEAK
jgi:endonuclease/exonuclease/phosphatase family metal-dependent hydrolase